MTPSISSLASILHEIRTPIQTVLGTAELLQETSLNPEQEEYVRQIMFSAKVLHTLSNDILDFEKLRANKFQIERIPFNLIQVVEQSICLVSIEAYNKGLELLCTIDYNIPRTVYGDPVRVQQVLLNFLKNAVKFTPSGYISLSVEMQKQDGQNVLFFQVSDTGIGIADDKKSTIFQPFVQVINDMTRQYGGSGLGLSICSQLVNLMGGYCGVKDNTPKGTTFYFSLPLEPAPGSAHPPKISLPADSRILVVDDSPEYRKNLLRILGYMCDAEVTPVASGKEALQAMKTAAAQHKNYTMVFIDLCMPVMDGWHLAAKINEDKNINDAKLYLMVPEGQLGSEAKMKMLSWFNDYMYKPIRRSQLYEIIRKTHEQPLELVSVEEPEEVVQPVIPLKTKKVIAVDDHPVNLKILTVFLQSFQAETITATTGAEAIQAAKDNPDAHIIFMDIQLPDMTGLEATKIIREEGFKNIIVACSANSDSDLVAEYAKVGIEDYIVKPFQKSQLGDILDKWCTVLEEREKPHDKN
ncbi:MAG: response regulator [Spirochaetia bacterium]|nr:response regulator [Spirochaetia bacterium]